VRLSGSGAHLASQIVRLLSTTSNHPHQPSAGTAHRLGRFYPASVLIPSIPQVMRLDAALDHFKPGLGDVAMVLAFTGLRWEEAAAVPIKNVDLDGQRIAARSVPVASSTAGMSLANAASG
jgi:hypothetical protein